jgi:hypothetical protein
VVDKVVCVYLTLDIFKGAPTDETEAHKEHICLWVAERPQPVVILFANGITKRDKNRGVNESSRTVQNSRHAQEKGERTSGPAVSQRPRLKGIPFTITLAE